MPILTFLVSDGQVQEEKATADKKIGQLQDKIRALESQLVLAVRTAETATGTTSQDGFPATIPLPTSWHIPSMLCASCFACTFRHDSESCNYSIDGEGPVEGRGGTSTRRRSSFG